MSDLRERIAQFVITRSDYFKEMDYHAPNKLYFLADTEEIYRGDAPFTTGIIFYDDLPDEGAERKLYIDNNTFEGYTWSNDKWFKILEQYKVVSEITDDADLDALINVEAIRKFIKVAISDIVYNNDTHSLDYTQGGIPKKVVIEGLLVDGDFDPITNKLIFKDVKGRTVFTTKIPKDNFPVRGYYDADTRNIVLQMRSGEDEEPYEIVIPAGDLVDVRISEIEGNLFKQYDDGYGVVLDVTGKIDKVPPGLDGRILTAKTDGNANAINMFVGGAHFSLITLEDGRVQADPNLLATESGVWHIIKDINGIIENLSKYTITQIIDSDDPDPYKYPSEVAVVDIYKDLNKAIQDLNTTLNELNSDNSDNAESIQKLIQELENINSRIDDINTETAATITPVINSIPELKEAVDNNTNEIAANANKISNLYNITNNTTVYLNILNENLIKLQGQHEFDTDDLQKQINNINLTISVMNQLISTIESQFNQQIADVNVRVDETVNSVNEFIDGTSFRYYM